MKKIFTLSVFALSMLSLTAQITITNATFPAAGDTLRTITDVSPVGISATPPGGPQQWDYSGLAGTTPQEIVFRPASEGSAFASFPGATLFTSVGGAGEAYYSADETTFNVLGISGALPGGGLPIETDFRYTPPLTERYAPLNFFDIRQLSTNLTIPIALSDIPGEILDSLGVPTGLADSIRIRVSSNRLDVADAYGTMTIPGGTYEVLREKRTEYRETRIDVHTFLGWLDITDQFAGLGDFGVDTINTHVFHNNTVKEFIAVVTFDSQVANAVSVTYKDNGVVLGVGDVEPSYSTVSVFPNPATASAEFKFENLPSGNYGLHLYDLNGRRVLSENMSSAGGRVSVGALANGMYVCQLVDAQNKIVATGKLQVQHQ